MVVHLGGAHHHIVRKPIQHSPQPVDVVEGDTGEDVDEAVPTFRRSVKPPTTANNLRVINPSQEDHTHVSRNFNTKTPPPAEGQNEAEVGAHKGVDKSRKGAENQKKAFAELVDARLSGQKFGQHGVLNKLSRWLRWKEDKEEDSEDRPDQHTTNEVRGSDGMISFRAVPGANYEDHAGRVDAY